jgi:hypothetical protein
MRTKLYVLGAVLGVVPGLLPGVSPLWGPPSQEARQDSRGVSRKGRGAHRVSPAPAGEQGGVAAPPDVAPPASGEPTHPCQLVTLLAVPCDPNTATCEYTYWDCPAAVKPLKA